MAHFVSVLPRLVKSRRSPWFAYLRAVYGEDVPLPFDLHSIRFVYHNTPRWQALHPRVPWPMPGCFGFHEAPPMCAPAECQKWYRDSYSGDEPAPPPYFHRVYPLNRTAGWTLGAKWESRVPITNPRAPPNTWVEVLRYRISIREGEAGYGFWFNRAPGSGVWINVGKTCRLLVIPDKVDPASEVNRTERTSWIDKTVCLGETGISEIDSEYNAQRLYPRLHPTARKHIDDMMVGDEPMFARRHEPLGAVFYRPWMEKHGYRLAGADDDTKAAAPTSIGGRVGGGGGGGNLTGAKNSNAVTDAIPGVTLLDESGAAVPVAKVLKSLINKRGVEPGEIFPFVAYELGFDTVQMDRHGVMTNAHEITVTSKPAMIARKCKSPPEDPNASMATWLRRCSPNTARYDAKALAKLPERKIGRLDPVHHGVRTSVVYDPAEGHREAYYGRQDWLQTLTCPDVEFRSGWQASKPCVCDARGQSTTCRPP